VRAAQIEQPSIADTQKNQNPPDQMVNVAAMHHYILERAYVPRNQVNQHANAGERNQERYRGDEQATPWPVGDGGPDEEAQACQLQQKEQNRNHNGGERQKQQGPCANHVLIEPLNGVAEKVFRGFAQPCYRMLSSSRRDSATFSLYNGRVNWLRPEFRS